MKFTIIIPAYNEEKSIAGTIKELKEVLDNPEIIVVDDGSKDNTLKIAQESGVKVVQHQFNKGYGAAIKTGIREAENEILGIIDADGTYPAKDFPRLLEFINENDMVVGVREKQNIPLLRRPVKRFLTKFAQYLVGHKIPDLNSGLRVFKKETVSNFLHLLPSGFSLTSTITVAMHINDYKIKYVPIEYYKRSGKSKIKPIRDTLNFFQLLTRITMYFNPLKIFLPISLFLGFLGIISLGYDILVLRDLTDKTVITVNTAILIAVIGLLADLINKRVR
jgi:glycosyltransferase involved in cell wall biosynthesis